jgi:hypothetical protein
VPTHWTYASAQQSEQLFQGDIIARSEALLKVLGEEHQHFCDPKYLAFTVVSQTCDLVLRKGACKARHVALAVVRPLDSILPDLLGDLCTQPAPGVYPRESRFQAEQLLERILNQNEQAHGLFYLHPDADAGIAVPAVAMLRISISLRSREHYRMLQDSRCGRLATEYRNKLGWLAGNLYSRVDTPDWADQPGGPEAAQRLVEDLLDRPGTSDAPLWVPEAWVRAARKANVELQEVPRDRLLALLEQHAPRPPREVVLERVRHLAAQLTDELGDREAERFLAAIQTDQALPVLAINGLSAAVEPLFGEEAAKATSTLAGWARSDDSRIPFHRVMRDRCGEFTRRRGPRRVSLFLEALAQGPMLDETAVEQVLGVLDRAGTLEPETREVVRDQLRQERFPGALLDRLRSLLRETVAATLAERLTRRLENDQAFQNAFRQG